jgi:predicted anti-sigma-YlaC factor YlaD
VDCSEVLEQLADYLDADARAEMCRAIEEHLRFCAGCRVEVDSVRKTVVLYQSDREVHVPSTALSGLKAALAREYAATGGVAKTVD